MNSIVKQFYYFPYLWLTNVKEYGSAQDIVFPLSFLSARMNSFLASINFCCLLITFANSLDPNIGPDMDPNHLTLL